MPIGSTSDLNFGTQTGCPDIRLNGLRCRIGYEAICFIADTRSRTSVSVESSGSRISS